MYILTSIVQFFLFKRTSSPSFHIINSCPGCLGEGLNWVILISTSFHSGSCIIFKFKNLWFQFKNQVQVYIPITDSPLLKITRVYNFVTNYITVYIDTKFKNRLKLIFNYKFSLLIDFFLKINFFTQLPWACL